MTNANKGLLLSGLVIPGLGQIALKRYFRGVMFMLASIGGLVFMSVEAVQVVSDWINAVTAHLETMDVNQIVAAFNQVLAETSARLSGAALLLILLAWIMSMVDAYRIGRRMDEQAGVKPSAP